MRVHKEDREPANRHIDFMTVSQRYIAHPVITLFVDICTHFNAVPFGKRQECFLESINGLICIVKRTLRKSSLQKSEGSLGLWRWIHDSFSTALHPPALC